MDSLCEEGDNKFTANMIHRFNLFLVGLGISVWTDEIVDGGGDSY